MLVSARSFILLLPGSTLSDGLFSVLVVRSNFSRWNMARLLLALDSSGGHFLHPMAEIYRVRAYRLEPLCSEGRCTCLVFAYSCCAFLCCVARRCVVLCFVMLCCTAVLYICKPMRAWCHFLQACTLWTASGLSTARCRPWCFPRVKTLSMYLLYPPLKPQ